MLKGGNKSRAEIVAALVTVTLLLTLGLQSRLAEVSSERWVGISVGSAGASRLEILEVEVQGPADQAGLRAGDEFAAINGKPVQSARDYDLRAGEFRRGESYRFEVVRDGEPLFFRVSPGRAFPWLSFLLNGIAILAYIFIAFLVLFQARDDLRCRVLILLNVAIAFELALPVYVIGSPALSGIFYAVLYLVVGLEMGLELHLASLLPERRAWWGRFGLAPACYVVGLSLGIFAAVTHLTEEFTSQVLPFPAYVAESLLVDWAQPLWGLVLMSLLAEASLRYPTAIGRRQAAMVLLGVAPWGLWLAYSLVAGQMDWRVPEVLTSFEGLILLFFPLSILVAIVRYRLFDLHLLLRRGVVYISLTLTLVVMFYLLVWGGASVLQSSLDLDSLWLVAGVTLLTGLLFAPLRDQLQSWVDRRFFPQRAEIGRRLSQLVRALPALGDLPAMSARLVEEISTLFNTEPVTLLVGDPDSGLLLHSATFPVLPEGSGQTLVLPRQDPTIEALAQEERPILLEQLSATHYALASRLRSQGYSLAVPSICQEDLVGVLLLGERASGEPLSPEELELLGLLGLHVATIFENIRLFESATRDSLTGLLRRQAVLDQLKNEMRRAVRFKRPLTLGMADLDRFKEVNDRFGHLAGDVILKRVGRALRRGLRKTDFVGRFGGEEFLFILPETDLQGGSLVAEKVREDVSLLEVVHADGTEIRSTISIGLASLEQLGEPTFEGMSLIAAADRALYRAKRLGRNRVEAFEPEA